MVTLCLQFKRHKPCGYPSKSLRLAATPKRLSQGNVQGFAVALGMRVPTCDGDEAKRWVPASLGRSMFERELGIARFVGLDDEHDDSG